jgi:hypothetical protein
MTRLIPFSTKLARFQEAQECKRNKPIMSQTVRREVAKKLKEEIKKATDPVVIAELANVLAKYLPKPKQTHRRRNTQPPIEKKKELSVNEVVALMEKQRKGKVLSAEERAALDVEGAA